MTPEVGSDGAPVVIMAAEAFFEELVGEGSGLRNDVYAVSDTKVNSSVVEEVVELLLIDEVKVSARRYLE